MIGAYNPFKPSKFLVFASKEAAKKEARESGGRVIDCQLLNANAEPILDDGAPVIVYKVIF